MELTADIDLAIVRTLQRHGACPLEELTRRLPHYGWNQMFAAVDRLSRNGQLTLRRLLPFDYLVSTRVNGSACPPQKLGQVNTRRLKL